MDFFFINVVFWVKAPGGGSWETGGFHFFGERELRNRTEHWEESWRKKKKLQRGCLEDFPGMVAMNLISFH